MQTSNFAPELQDCILSIFCRKLAYDAVIGIAWNKSSPIECQHACRQWYVSRLMPQTTHAYTRLPAAVSTPCFACSCFCTHAWMDMKRDHHTLASVGMSPGPLSGSSRPLLGRASFAGAHGTASKESIEDNVSKGVEPGVLRRNGSESSPRDSVIEEETGLDSALNTVRTYLDSINDNLEKKIQVVLYLYVQCA